MFPSKYRTIRYCEEIKDSWDENLKYDKPETSILLDKIMTEMFAMSLEDEIEVINSISNEAISRIAYITWDLIDNQEGMEEALIELYEKTKNEELKKELTDFGIRFGIVSEYDEKRLNELLTELDKYWNSSLGPRFKGENPKCEELQTEIVYLFNVMTDEQIRELFNNSNDNQKEQLEYPIDCILMYRPYIFKEDYEIDTELIGLILELRKNCYLNDERSIEDCHYRLIGALGENEDKAIDYIMTADKEVLSWLTEIIEELYAKFSSERMEKTIDYIMENGQ